MSHIFFKKDETNINVQILYNKANEVISTMYNLVSKVELHDFGAISMINSTYVPLCMYNIVYLTQYTTIFIFNPALGL